MRFEEILRDSRRLEASAAARARWRQAVFAPESAGPPGWVPSLASGLAMAGMLLLLWPAAARGPVSLRTMGEACDGRWELAVPLRADVRGVARAQALPGPMPAADSCGRCHVP